MPYFSRAFTSLRLIRCGIACSLSAREGSRHHGRRDRRMWNLAAKCGAAERCLARRQASAQAVVLTKTCWLLRGKAHLASVSRGASGFGLAASEAGNACSQIAVERRLRARLQSFAVKPRRSSRCPCVPNPARLGGQAPRSATQPRTPPWAPRPQARSTRTRSGPGTRQNRMSFKRKESWQQTSLSSMSEEN